MPSFVKASGGVRERESEEDKSKEFGGRGVREREREIKERRFFKIKEN